jgi:hypothetical protein
VCVDSYGAFIIGMKNVQYVRFLGYANYVRNCYNVYFTEVLLLST